MLISTLYPCILVLIGLLEAPSDVMFDIVSRDRVIVSWSPPFTLDGIPILYYIVNIISQGVVTEQINTTETLITLERPCVSTTYQISAWNDVGEGNATISGKRTLLYILYCLESFNHNNYVYSPTCMY